MPNQYNTSALLRNKTKSCLTAVILTVLFNYFGWLHRQKDFGQTMPGKLFTVAGCILFYTHKNKTSSLSLSQWSLKEMIQSTFSVVPIPWERKHTQQLTGLHFE